MAFISYTPVFDVPPGVVVYPVRRFDFCFTGPGDLGFLDWGEYKDKLYWYFHTKLVDENHNFLGWEHPAGSPEYVQVRVRFSNGIKEFFSITPYFVNVALRYLDKDQAHLATYPLGRMSTDKVHDEVILIKNTPAFWQSIRYIELLPTLIEPGFSGGGDPINWGSGGLPIVTF
jgi:hypothetical protein